MQNEKLIVKHNDREIEILFDSENENKTILINGEEHNFEIQKLPGNAISILLDGKSHIFRIIPNNEGYSIGWSGGEIHASVEDDRDRLMKKLLGNHAGSKSRKRIKAPMPGLVVKLLTEVGAEVKKGDPLVIVEAMKMENEIASPSDGVVAEIKVSEKQAVEKDEVMITLEG